LSLREGVVGLSLVIAGGAASALAQERVSGEAPAQAKTQYRDLVLRYARGERALAVAGLARFPNVVLTQIARAIEDAGLAAMRGEAGPAAAQALKRGEVALRRSEAGDPLIPLRAALMLHVDLDEAERPRDPGVMRRTEQPRVCPGRQVLIASRYARLLAGQDETKSFARRFFVALAHGCQWDCCLLDAARWAREGLTLFPRDPELLLAAGSVLEESATLWPGGSTVENPALPPTFREFARAAAAERERVTRYRQARALYEDAIAADDSLIQARVRLGRVLWRLGNREAAQAALEASLERSADPLHSYLAHLFLGQVHEDSGRLAQAVEQYRLSLALDPSAQTAAVALSHALHSAGEGEEARGVLRQALALAGRRALRDGYWDYLALNALHFRDLFAALRQESLI
jgi:tetratricopeptide (TPR) repeat protein